MGYVVFNAATHHADFREGKLDPNPRFLEMKISTLSFPKEVYPKLACCWTEHSSSNPCLWLPLCLCDLSDLGLPETSFVFAARWPNNNTLICQVLQNSHRAPAKGKNCSSFWAWGNFQNACLFLFSNVRSLVQPSTPYIGLMDGTFLPTLSFLFSSYSAGRCLTRRGKSAFRYHPHSGSDLSLSFFVLVVSHN